MSSNVLYKFRSQKDPSRITFDGTGISVFEVKRDIIKRDIRTDGRDLDLLLYNKDTKEEYTDDTTLIPRSTVLEAVRRPAARPGQGRCARYLTGPMPTIAKSSYQRAAPANNPTSGNTQGRAGTTQGEDDDETAALRARDSYWEQEKQKMAGATPVFFSKKPGAKPNDAKPHIERRGPPSHPYVCHRCSKPGHWIEECPTNGDEKFNHRPRFKRATGIPRSNLEVIEGDEDEEDEGLADGKRQTVMINELGQRVRARPDEVAWEQHKAKVDASKEKQDLVALDSEELQAQGLLCPIDKRAFVDPASAPCCGKTYCHECIENALLDSGLVCPGCETENIFVEALVPNSDVAAKLKAYEDAKKSKNEEPSSSRPSTASGASVKSVGDGDASKFLKVDSMTKPDSTPGTPADKSPKKRPAEAELPNDRTGRAPTSAEKSKTKSSKSPSRERESTLEPAVGSGGRSTPVDAPKGPAAERNAASSSDATAFPNMNFPIMDMNAMNAMNMNMNPMMMGMMPGFNPYMNPMMGGGMMGGMPNMNGMNGMNNNQQYPTGPSNFQNNRFGGRGMNINQPFNPGNNSSMRGAYNNNFGKHNNFGGQRFGVNQQFNNNNTNDGAYERAPVNGRARNHANREMRPAEYKEL